ncbi:uncharacterized protein LOC125028674 [Penaeus chinensis]|uniref:uncharacterized protein LOC125028674 n=1 Tax=Penaeus chinensis TaxID=139456 RepID=UPI001FB7FCA8|nr:uncharacterized protein LOC125028674 [Penaeus chinensis]
MATCVHSQTDLLARANGRATEESDDVTTEDSPVITRVAASVAHTEVAKGRRRGDGDNGGGDDVADDDEDAELVAAGGGGRREEGETSESLSAAARLPKAQALQGVHQGLPQGLPQGSSGRQVQPAGSQVVSQVGTQVGTQGSFQTAQTIQSLNFGRIPTSCALCSRERNLCRIISGIFTRPRLPYGYSLVTPIPAGVCNVTITEMKPSKNFFALRRTDGTYVLNGNWDIQAAGQYQAGGTVFTYTPSDDDSGEQLAAPGPLRESIELMLISQSPNPGIKYEYRVPLSEYLGGGTGGLTPSSGGLVPNMGGKVGPATTGIGSTQGRGLGLGGGNVPPGQVTPFQGTPNVGGTGGIRTPAGGGAVKPNLVPRVPGLLPYGPSNPNIANGGILPLTPVIAPINPGGAHGTFTPSGGVPFKPLSPQGGVGRAGAGTPPRNPAYVGSQPRLPTLDSSGGAAPRGTLPGIAGVPSRGQPLTPIGTPNQGSGSLPLPWNPSYTSQDGGRGLPLGTPYQFPGTTGGSGVTTGSGFPGQRLPVPSRADGGGLETPGFPPEFPKNSVPLRPVAVARPGSPGARRPPTVDGDASSAASNTHRTRHHHGTKGNGRRKSPGKAPGRPQTPFGPGVQLTQPNVLPSSPSEPQAVNVTTTSGRRSKSERRRQKGEGASGESRRRKGRKRSRFQWAEKGFTPCSRECGGGNQTTILSCERRRKHSVVADRHCAHLPRPETHTIMCNLKPCPATWMPGEWGPCSVSCGIGVQTRPLLCKQQVSPNFIMMVPEGACLSPPTVSTSQVCEMGRCPSASPEWEASAWSNCSAPCGLGKRFRQVKCVASGVQVQDGECEGGSRPQAEEVCDMGSCATSTWFFSEWAQQCSERCGTGVQTRRVHCLSATESSRGTCPAEARPDATRPCRGESGCGGQWFTGPWGACSEECGPGTQARSVVCVTLAKGLWKIVKDNRCPMQARPQDNRDCDVRPCTPEWFTSEWSECSASCEGGVMRREVTCLDPGRRPSAECHNTTKPASRQPCHLHSCDAIPTTTAASVSSSTSGFIVPRPPNAESDEEATSRPLEAEGDPTTEENPAGVEDGQEEDTGEGGVEEGTERTGETYEGEEEGEEENELVVVEETGSITNVIPDKDAQGDESVSEGGDGDSPREEEEEEKEKRKRKRKKEKKKNRQNKGEEEESPSQTQPATVAPSLSCIDRIKNCHLVFRARLCRLKYYNRLCCRTCSAAR